MQETNITLKQVYDLLPKALDNDKKNIRDALAHIENMIEATDDEEQKQELYKLRTGAAERLAQSDEMVQRIQKWIQQLAANIRAPWGEG